MKRTNFSYVCSVFAFLIILPALCVADEKPSIGKATVEEPTVEKLADKETNKPFRPLRDGLSKVSDVTSRAVQGIITGTADVTRGVAKTASLGIVKRAPVDKAKTDYATK